MQRERNREGARGREGGREGKGEGEREGGGEGEGEGEGEGGRERKRPNPVARSYKGQACALLHGPRCKGKYVGVRRFIRHLWSFVLHTIITDHNLYVNHDNLKRNTCTACVQPVRPERCTKISGVWGK